MNTRVCARDLCVLAHLLESGRMSRQVESWGTWRVFRLCHAWSKLLWSCMLQTRGGREEEGKGGTDKRAGGPTMSQTEGELVFCGTHMLACSSVHSGLVFALRSVLDAHHHSRQGGTTILLLLLLLPLRPHSIPLQTLQIEAPEHDMARVRDWGRRHGNFALLPRLISTLRCKCMTGSGS